MLATMMMMVSGQKCLMLKIMYVWLGVRHILVKLTAVFGSIQLGYFHIPKDGSHMSLLNQTQKILLNKK